ncbi:MAG TPA: hypothetical protein VFI78_03770 [Salinimicrobium sp.]|nr:hypothetical protein [Salinimicrobium sp.]
MENPKAKKLLKKIQDDLAQNGIITNTITQDLKELRPFAVEEKQPLLAKIIRLTFEHIEAYKTFDIPIPEDEPVEGFEEEAQAEQETSPEESLQYLFSLIADSNNKLNKEELREYCNALVDYED